jgi:putative toxin-antitoxin system antitoxin component (TIGR02293 family)
MASNDIAQVLGGEKVLGRKIHNEAQLEQCARDGFPLAVLHELVERAVLLPAELYAWIIPRRTLAHRQKRRQHLSLEESNRVSRVARIYALALETLGEDEKAKRWLRRPLTQFRGRTPMEMLETDLGAHQVEVLLGRIGHGLAA